MANTPNERSGSPDAAWRLLWLLTPAVVAVAIYVTATGSPGWVVGVNWIWNVPVSIFTTWQLRGLRDLGR